VSLWGAAVGPSRRPTRFALAPRLGERGGLERLHPPLSHRLESGDEAPVALIDAWDGTATRVGSTVRLPCLLMVVAMPRSS
jgi:hypothetical protein